MTLCSMPAQASQKRGNKVNDKVGKIRKKTLDLLAQL
jgi:hypothetical protein